MEAAVRAATQRYAELVESDMDGADWNYEEYGMHLAEAAVRAYVASLYSWAVDDTFDIHIEVEAK